MRAAGMAARRGDRGCRILAKDLKRPGVQEALRALKAGEGEALVVAKLDRLSRSMIDFTGLMGRAQKEGWALVALDCAVDTTTPAGEAMAHMLATFAQFERRLISQRTKGLSRKGGGEGCEVGFLEGDEAAGELEECEVVLVFLRPADQDAAVAVQP